MLTKFLDSRRQGISPRTIEFYDICLRPFAGRYELTPEGINQFLASLKCGNAKHSYFRTIRAFCNWLVKQGYLDDNPVKKVDAPKLKREILPSLTTDQVQYLIEQIDSLRDRTIVTLSGDKGIRTALF